MATSFLTPNMNLTVPVPGQEPGPQWANDINNSLAVIDAHNHAPGSGVQINPDGLNINADLTFNSNDAISLRTVRFAPQVSAIAATTPDLGCLYEAGVDLYYNDGSGNQIRITQGGSVTGSTGTITGLPSGTASAAYVSGSGTFVFQQATATAANLDVASIAIRYPGSYPTPAGNYIQLQAPTSLASGYSITLPSLPSGTSVMTLSSVGVIATQTYDQVGQNMSSVGANAIQVTTTRTTGTTVGTGGVALSTSSGAYSANTSSLPVAVPNLSVTITTSGRPVQIMLIPDGSMNGSNIGISAINGTNIDGTFFYVYRNGAEIARINPRTDISNGVNAFSQGLYVPVGGINYIDPVAAGTYTYSIQASSDNAASGPTVYVNYAVLATYEL